MSFIYWRLVVTTTEVNTLTISSTLSALVSLDAFFINVKGLHIINSPSHIAHLNAEQKEQ